MEIIQKIEDTTFRTKNSYGGEEEFEGFVITTDRQAIKIGVDNSSSCCEEWGHFASVDNFEDFVGATLSKVDVVDAALNARMLDKEKETYCEKDMIMYVNLDTDRGILQFAAYNSHNGYYGHEGIVLSEQLNYTTTL